MTWKSSSWHGRGSKTRVKDGCNGVDETFHTHVDRQIRMVTVYGEAYGRSGSRMATMAFDPCPVLFYGAISAFPTFLLSNR